MTTRREAARLKEAYRLALHEGHVAHYRGMFRDGRIVLFKIDDDTGFSDGLAMHDRVALVGQFQLRYWSQHHGQPSTSYGVHGRLDGATKDSDWVLVDGPWKVGDGPFDNRHPRAPFSP